MFGGKKKLYAEGAQTEGVVLKQSASNDRIHFRVVVRAKFPDGSTSEFHSQFLDFHDVGNLYQGAVVPVRYDASDRSKIGVDIPALQARHQQAAAAQQAQLDAQVAHLGEPGARPADSGGRDLRAQLLELAAQNPGSVIELRSSQASEGQTSDPVERLAKLAELKQQGALTEEEFAAAKAKILDQS